MNMTKQQESQGIPAAGIPCIQKPIVRTEGGIPIRKSGFPLGSKLSPRQPKAGEPALSPAKLACKLELEELFF